MMVAFLMRYGFLLCRTKAEKGLYMPDRQRLSHWFHRATSVQPQAITTPFLHCFD
jgi:hypothetical protein